jgi:hypothetical protein
MSAATDTGPRIPLELQQMIIRLAMASYHSNNSDDLAPSILPLLSVSKSWHEYALPQFYRRFFLSRGSTYHRFAKHVRSELGLSHRKYVKEVVFDLRQGRDDKCTLTSNVIQAILQSCRRVRTIAVHLDRREYASWWFDILGKSASRVGPQVLSHLTTRPSSKSQGLWQVGLLNLLTTWLTPDMKSGPHSVYFRGSKPT